MKKYVLLFGIILISNVAFSQTTATNFNCNDCSGNNHDLFSELDAGKVVVMAWVMPCGACIGPSLTAYNIVQSYETSDPGRVLFYLVDDYANTSCTSLNSWGTSNIGSDITATFSNSSISMSDYGTDGMPKVVVLGGSSHTIYFNQNNTVNSTDLQNAIDQALVATGINDTKADIRSFGVYPNPVHKTAYITYTLKNVMNVKIAIYNILGEKVKLVISEKQNAGKHQLEINTDNFINGIYFININDTMHKLQISN